MSLEKQTGVNTPSLNDTQAQLTAELRRFTNRIRVRYYVVLAIALIIILPLLFLVVIPNAPAGIGSMTYLIFLVILPIVLVPLGKLFQSRKDKELGLASQTHPEDRLFSIDKCKGVKARLLIVHDDSFEFRQAASESLIINHGDIRAISYRDLYGTTFSKLFGSRKYAITAFGISTPQQILLFVVVNRFKAGAKPLDARGTGDGFALEASAEKLIALMRSKQALNSRIIF